MKQVLHHLSFKNRYDLAQRKQKFNKYHEQQSDKIPIIVEPLPGSKLPYFKNSRFCLTKQKSAKYLQVSLVQKLSKMDTNVPLHNKGIFLYIGKKILQGNLSIEDLYNKYKESDGFLYIYYAQMQVF